MHFFLSLLPSFRAAYGILVSRLGIEARPWQWVEPSRILTTGLPRNSLDAFSCLFICRFIVYLPSLEY